MTAALRRTGIALALLSLAACSTNESATTTNPATTPISIVTSTSIWGDVASAVAATADGVDITVTPIVTGNNVNPHDFEPSAADMAKVAEADFVVVGGRGYDAWLYDKVEDSKVVHALELSEHDHDDEFSTADNEHVWYDVDAVEEVAEEIAERINTIAPAAHAHPDTLDARLNSIETKIEALPALRVAQTEPIADFLIADSRLTEVTPAGYRATTLSEGEPTAADLDSFLRVIEAHQLDLLIYNPQTETDLAERIRNAAAAAGIPIVELSETPAEGENYLDFFSAAVDRLEEGAREAA